VIPVGQHALQIGNQTYSQLDVPSLYAAGWQQNSAPLGKAGNTVINGHHNAYGEVFRYLVSVQPGDTLILEAQGRRYTYVIAQTMVLPEEDEPLDVRRENARWILPTADERVTLITCWPYSSNTHRLIVIALPIASPERPSDMP
jgi:sortase A